MQVAEPLASRPLGRRQQQRVHAFAIGHQMRHRAVTKRVFEHRPVVEVDGRVGRFFVPTFGGHVVALNKRDPRQLDHRHGRERVIVHSAGDERSFEGGLGLSVFAGSGEGHAELHVDITFRPMVRLSRAARADFEQLAGQRIERTNGAEDVATATHRLAGAAHDFLRRQRHEHRHLNDAASLQHGHLVQRSLRAERVLLIHAELELPLRLSPRHARHCIAGDGRHEVRLELHADHPVGMLDEQIERDRVLIERRAVIAELEVALACHRVVADRVEPSHGAGLDRARLSLAQEVGDGRAERAVVIVAEARPINLRRSAKALRVRCCRSCHDSNRRDRQQYG